METPKKKKENLLNRKGYALRNKKMRQKSGGFKKRARNTLNPSLLVYF